MMLSSRPAAIERLGEASRHSLGVVSGKSAFTIVPQKVTANLFCPDCQGGTAFLGGIKVTASRTAAVIDHWVIDGLFSMYGEMGVAVEYWLEQQAANTCAEWNTAYWDWYEAHQRVNEAADALADQLDAMADSFQAAAEELDVAELSCKKVPGKPLCIDFFIPNCKILQMAGDCRNFSPNADWSQSRVQLYINPVSRIWEVKYNCTKVTTWGGGPALTVCDSAQVFNPEEDVQVLAGDSLRVVVNFRNNVCAYLGMVCDAIDAGINAELWFAPDPSKPGGYRVSWNRDGFPAMGVYFRNSADTGFDIMAEDSAKATGWIGVMRALAGQVRSLSVPPPENPNQCSIQ